MRDPMRGDSEFSDLWRRLGGGAATPGPVTPFQALGQQAQPDSVAAMRLLRLVQGGGPPGTYGAGQHYTPEQLRLSKMTGLPPHAFPPQGLGGCCG